MNNESNKSKGVEDPLWSKVFEQIWGERGYPYYDLDKAIAACKLYATLSHPNTEVGEPTLNDEERITPEPSEVTQGVDGEWHCPKCESYVSAECVTHEETHTTCGTGVVWVEGGPSLKDGEEYWKRRCELAERFIKESPCDPDVHQEQLEAYSEWQNFIASTPQQSSRPSVGEGEPKVWANQRNNMQEWTPAEHAIFNALQEVEKIGADERLTWAVIKLTQAKDLVADFLVSNPNTEYMGKSQAFCADYERLFGKQPTPSLEDALHPETLECLQLFHAALVEKSVRNEKKYGWTNEWKTHDWEQECREQLMKHIEKGDPRDVAIYAAFMWARGWTTANESKEASLEDGEKPVDIDGWNCGIAHAANCLAFAGLGLPEKKLKAAQDEIRKLFATHGNPAPWETFKGKNLSDGEVEKMAGNIWLYYADLEKGWMRRQDFVNALKEFFSTIKG